MNKLAVALALLASLAVPAASSAAEGPFLVRVRGVYINPADKSDSIPALGVPADKVSVSKKLIPEVDISYFFLVPNLSAELILTYPQEHDVKVDGTKIGTATHLPPCLTAQWHFIPGGVVNPYVGAGVNFTLFTASNLNDKSLELDSYSLGVVGQVGADFRVTDQVYLNADVKYVTIGSDVKAKATGQKLTSISIDPWLFGLGLGYRF
jgi:outer membrane protein